MLFLPTHEANTYCVFIHPQLKNKAHSQHSATGSAPNCKPEWVWLKVHFIEEALCVWMSSGWLCIEGNFISRWWGILQLLCKTLLSTVNVMQKWREQRVKLPSHSYRDITSSLILSLWSLAHSHSGCSWDSSKFPKNTPGGKLATKNVWVHVCIFSCTGLQVIMWPDH